MKCDKKDCEHNKSNGDNFFCEEHRLDWRLFCINNGVVLNTPESIVLDFKNKFVE